ncbi:serine-rich adhesin for platelets-like isoform X2 [Haliotis asinina]|uniref:serine-rich adhesin for platelets-like isoform X2 n=1 Tax=Haliotis asinina TaxID=109174 RepID=UPI003531D33D
MEGQTHLQQSLDSEVGRHDGGSERPETQTSCPQITFSVDTGAGAHTPLTLKVLAKQTLIMDSDGTESDFSDFDVNTFAKRDLRSPRLRQKYNEDSEDESPRNLKDNGSTTDLKRKWDNGSDLRSLPSPTKKQKDETTDERSDGIKKLDVSVSSVDSAVGVSLNNTPGSGMSDTSSFDSNTDTDDSSSPIAGFGGTEGTYHRINSSGKTLPPLQFSNEHVSEQFMKLAADVDSVRSLTLSNGNDGFVENLILHRLEDENLGMRLSVEGGKSSGYVKAVIVRSVVEEGAAYRASGSSVGICAGDEILEVNGTNLRRLNHDDCIAVFKNIPLRVHLVVKRAEPPPHHRMSGQGGIVTDVRILSGSEMPELGNLDGFILQDVTIRKTGEESLGISIVPSYGTTRDFYQVKRLLPSGACARSGRLQVGDRLLQCNGQLLKGLTQAQCLSALKKAGDNVTFRILRQEESDTTLEIVSDLSKHNQTASISSSLDLKESDRLTCEERISSNLGAVQSQRDTLNESQEDQPSINEVFAQQNVKLAFSQPFPPQQFSDDSESVTDSSMSSPVKETKDLLDMDNEQLIDVGGFEIKTDSSGQLDNTYIVDTPAVDLESTPRDWEMENDAEYVSSGMPLVPIIEGIPPPVEFADMPPDIVSEPPKEPDQTVPVTNIDDLLGLDDEDSAPETNQQETVQYNSQPLDLLLDVGGTDPSAISLEVDGEVSEKTTDLSGDLLVPDIHADISNSHSNQLEGGLENSVEVGDLLGGFREENVTSVENTSIDEFISIGHVTQIPIRTDEDVHKEKKTTEDVVHMTTKSVNQHIVTKVDVAKDEDDETPDIPVSALISLDDQQKLKPAVIEVNGTTSPKSTMIHIDQGQKLKNASPIHFVPPVQSASVKDSYGEDVITPMKIKREMGGVRLFEEGAAETTAKAGQRQADPEAKRDLAAILVELTKSSGHIKEKSEANSTSVTEEDIVPTKIAREDAQKVLGVFEKWLSGGQKAPVSPFKKMVSNIIEAKPKVTKIRVGSTTPIHVMPPVQSGSNNDSGEEEIITPILVRKDKQGVRTFEEGSASGSPVHKPRVIDEEAKKNLAKILSGLTTSYEQNYMKKKSESSSVDEQEIIPTKVSREDAQTIMNVFRNWLKSDEKPKANPFKQLVSNVIESLDEQENEDTVTVTKDTSTPVIEKVIRTENNNVQSASPQTGSKEPDIIASSHVSSSFAPPKPAARVTRSPPKATPSELQEASPRIPPTPAPKPSSPRETLVSTQKPSNPDENNVLPQEPPSTPTPPSPRQSLKSTNRSVLPPLTVSRGLPKMGALSTTIKTQGLQFSTTKLSKQEYQKMRKEDGLFQVDVLKGIVGLGIKIQADTDKFARVSEIQRNSPVDKNGQIKVGDFVLSINNTTLTGQSDARIQQILRLLPRGLAKIVVSAVQPSEEDCQHPTGKSDILLTSADKPAGRTSPFGVRLGAKPFNTDESKSVTVTSPLTRDSGFFESKRKSSLSQQDKQSAAVDSAEQPAHVSTIDVTKKVVEVKPEEKKPDEKHVSTINVVKSTEIVTDKSDIPIRETSSTKLQTSRTVTDVSVDSGVKSKSHIQEAVETVPTADNRKVEMTTTFTETEVEMETNPPVAAERKQQKLERKNEPLKVPRPAPRQSTPMEQKIVVNEEGKPAVEEQIESINSPVLKSPPKVPPKPKARASLNDTASPPALKFVEETVVKSQSEVNTANVDTTPKFVSNILVEKEPSPPRIPTKSIVMDEIDEGVVPDIKVKPHEKTPPPVPPKPRRTSSASSDVSSVISDDFHIENEVEFGQRRRRRSSASSEKSTASVKSDGRPEEMYVPRRKDEQAPEKRSVKEKMAAFEAFQKPDETDHSRKSSSSSVTSLRKISSSSQGHEVPTPKSVDPPKPKSRTDLVSFPKNNGPEEDGVFIVSRISIKSQVQSDNKEENSSPVSPTSPTSPKSPDGKVKINSALAPKKRTGLSEPKTKPEQGHYHHAVPKTSSSIFKPTGLERLKNITGHNTDSGEVAHSSSPEGTYKIGPVKMNNALSPRRTSTGDPPSPVGLKFGSSAYKLHAGDGKKIMSTSKLSDHKHVDVSQIVPDSAQDTAQQEGQRSISGVTEDVSTTDNTELYAQSSVPDTLLHKDVTLKVDLNTGSLIIDGATVKDSNTDETVGTDSAENETEIDNVNLKTEEVKEQITVPSKKTEYEEKEPVPSGQETVTTTIQEETHTPASQEEVLTSEQQQNILTPEQHVEKLVDGSSGFAAKIVAASLEAAKEQLKVEAKIKVSEPSDAMSENTETQIAPVQAANAERVNDNQADVPAKPLRDERSKYDQDTQKEQLESENEIKVNTEEEVTATISAPPNSVDIADEDDLETNAAELVAATLESAKKQLGHEEQTVVVSSPCPSPPPLPGSAPPPLPSGPPPPIPTEESADDLVETDTHSGISKTATEVVESVPVYVLEPEVNVSVQPELKSKSNDEDDAPPLPLGPPPPGQTLLDDTDVQSGVVTAVLSTDIKYQPKPQTTDEKTYENNEWVEEIEKVAAQESQFDLLINFDSQKMPKIENTATLIETPSSDTDSGVSLQMTSPTSPSAIENGAVEFPGSSTKSDSITTEVQSSELNTVKLVSTSVEPVVASSVSRNDIESMTETDPVSLQTTSVKTVTVQYSSNTSPHEQDSFSSVDSLHDNTPSVVPTKTQVSVTNTDSRDIPAPVSQVSAPTEILSDSSNASISQVSSSRESSPSAALKDSKSSHTSSSKKVFSSTPSKDLADSQQTVFEPDVSSIQFTSTKVNASHDEPPTERLSSSSVLNKSLNVSTKSRTSSTSGNKRRWKMVMTGEDAVDMSISDLMKVSDTSLISRDELSRMIDLANQRMDKTGISLEDEIVVVVLTRDNQEEDLGFELRDGILRSKVVCGLKSGGLAEKDQRLQLKDNLLSVNGNLVDDMSAEEVMKLLSEPSQHVTLVLAREGTNTSSNGQTTADTSVNGNGTEAPVQEGPGIFEVVMKKGVTGVGFCLEGGLGSPKGDMPILIRRIFKGGPAEKCGQLRVKDEILKVNDIDFTNLRHYEAWNNLKFLPDGDVRILIQRK